MCRDSEGGLIIPQIPLLELLKKFDSHTLTLTLLPIPTLMCRDSEGGLIIPQIPLLELLKKFDSHTWTDQVHEARP